MEYLENEKGRQKSICLEQISKNKQYVIEAYNNGFTAQIMTLKLSLRTCLAALNGLYRQDGINSIHLSRFYRDLCPIFGEDYVFTKEDLFYERKDNHIVYIYYDSRKNCKNIRYYCLSSVMASIISSAYYTKMINLQIFKKLIVKYMTFTTSRPFQEERRKEKERRKRKMEREKARKEWEERPRIFYTPMGNDNRRKTRGVK